MQCPSCQTKNRPEAAFCASCGAALASSGPSAPDVTAGLGVTVAGRYQLEALIGEGAMKQVWSARDASLDRRVAVALFKSGGLKPDDLVRIDREIGALVRLDEHPSIIGVIDVGDFEGSKFIVTPLMEEGDLAARITQNDGEPLDLAEAARIGGEIASALDHVHSHGLIHRDVKPENIWLGGGSARLGDFGLVVRPGGSRVTHDGTVLGTPAYLAPECASGGLAADSRSDLYSLGVVIYEMCTGRRPFEGSVSEVIAQHLGVTPISPRSLNPQISVVLDRLIRAMLAKSPLDRPESASEVATALRLLVAGELEVSAGGSQDPADLLAHFSPRRPMVGRASELGAASRVIDTAASGEMGVVAISGEPGIGKTTLATELTAYAELRGFAVIRGSCVDDEGAPAFWPWIDALNQLAGQLDREDAQLAVAAGGPALCRLSPVLAEVLPAMESRMVPADPSQARFELFAAVRHFLQVASEARPVAVLLEDIHWADEPSLKLLSFIMKGRHEGRLACIVTFRDVELGRHHPLAATLGDLAGSLIQIPLKGIERTEVEKMIADRLDADAAGALAETVLAKTDGNPYFVHEVVELIAQDPDQYMSGAGSLAIPQGVRQAVGERLGVLSGTADAALSVAAVIGFAFDLDLLGRAAPDIEVESLYEAMAEAEEAGVVESVGTHAGGYRFRHAIVRETLYSELSTTRVALVHRRIGSAIESLHARDLTPHLGELAFHYLHAIGGEDLHKGIDYALSSARAAVDALAYEAGIASYEMALDAIELAGEMGGGVHVDALIGLGDALWRIRDSARAKSTLLEAFNLAIEAKEARRAANAILLYPGVIGGIAILRESITDEIDAARGLLGSGDESLICRLDAMRALTMSMDEDELANPVRLHERQQKLFGQAIGAARKSGDEQILMEVLAAAHHPLGDPSETIDRIARTRESCDIARKHRDFENVITQELLLYSDLIETGDFVGAEAIRLETTEIAASGEAGSRAWAADALDASRALMVGDLETARRRIASYLSATNHSDDQEMLKAVLWAVQSFVLFNEEARVRDLGPVFAATVSRFGGSIPVAKAILAVCNADRGATDSARAEIEHFAESGFVIPLNANYLFTTAVLAMAAAMIGDADSCRELSRHLEPWTGRFVMAPGGGGCLGAVDLHLGRMRLVSGDRRAGLADLERALTLHELNGLRPAAAHTHAEIGRCLLASGQESDRAVALDHLERASAEYESLLMNGWLDATRTLIADTT